MLIAYDGGAFQPGASVGLLNCTVGLLNAIAETDPTVEFILVADPRAGELDPAALARLTSRIEVIYAPVSATHDPPPRGLLTNQPDIRFVVDDLPIPAKRDGNEVWYEGPPPRRSFVIVSRCARPCDVSDSGDTRMLGIPIEQIEIDGKFDPPCLIAHSDPVLQEGFSADEPSWRWTDGKAILPLHLFPDVPLIRVRLKMAMHYHHYRIGGTFDRAFNRIERELQQRERKLALSQLAGDLRTRGAAVYVANHLLPVAIPDLRLAAWAYDLAAARVPKHFSPTAIASFQANLEIFRRADCVFGVAPQVCTDLNTVLGIAAERILPVSIDPVSERPSYPGAALAQLRQRLGLPSEYILCVGMLEPRNLHVRLVQAYHRFAQMQPIAPPLVIIGKSAGGYQPIIHEIEARLLQSHVLILRDLPREDLAMLYTGALFIVYPSLYDGFKLPVLDAMSYRKPILTSRNSIMAELASDAAIAVDFDEVEQVADALGRLAIDGEFRTERVRRGDQQRASRNWLDIAQPVLARLRELSST